MKIVLIILLMLGTISIYANPIQKIERCKGDASCVGKVLVKVIKHNNYQEQPTVLTCVCKESARCYFQGTIIFSNGSESLLECGIGNFNSERRTDCYNKLKIHSLCNT